MAKVFIDSKGNRTTSGSTTKSRGGSSNSSALQKLAESVGGRVINDNQGGQKVEYQVRGNGFKATRYLNLGETADMSSPYERKRDDGRNNPNRVTVAEPIDASQIGAGQVSLPEQPKLGSEAGTLAAGNIAVGLNPDGTQKTVETPTTTQQSTDQFKTLLDSYLGNMPTPPSATDIYKKLPEKRAFEEASREVNQYSSQINAIVTKSQAAQLEAIGQGRGIPEAIIGGQQAQIAREAAIQALPLQALLANAQGNKELAQQQLDTMFKLKMQDAQSQYDYKTKVLGLVYDYATNAEKRRLDDIQRKEDQAFELKKADIAFERDKYLQQMSFSNQLALKRVDIANEATKEAQKIAEAERAGANEAFTGYSLANTLLNSGQVENVVGINRLNPFNYIPGTKVQYAKNQFNQLKSSLSLENREKLKGQGAVSDFEGRLLDRAASALGTNLSNKDAERELKQIRGAFANAAGQPAQIKITDPTTGKYVVVSGTRETVNQALADGALVEYY